MGPTWKDAVAMYAFLIRGEGKMSGEEFAERIGKAYSLETPQNAAMVEIARRQIVWIEAERNGKLKIGLKFEEL